MKEYFPQLKAYLLKGNDIVLDYNTEENGKNRYDVILCKGKSKSVISSNNSMIDALSIAENVINGYEKEYYDVVNRANQLVNNDDMLKKLNHIATAYAKFYKEISSIPRYNNCFKIFAENGKMYCGKLLWGGKKHNILVQTFAENSICDLLMLTCNRIELDTNKSLLSYQTKTTQPVK